MSSQSKIIPFSLVGALLLSAVFAAINAYSYWKDSGELRRLQAQAVAIENNRAVIRGLAAETMEYSKRNPAIDPVLQSFGLKQPLASPKASK